MTTFYRSGVKDFSFWNILSSREKKKKADIEKNLNKMKWHVAIQLHLETGSFTNFCEYVFQDFHVTINFKAFFFFNFKYSWFKKKYNNFLLFSSGYFSFEDFILYYHFHNNIWHISCRKFYFLTVVSQFYFIGSRMLIYISF